MIDQHTLMELAKRWGWLIPGGFLLRWAWRVFIRATDVTVGYNWSFDGTMSNARNLRPNFDIRNVSQSRTYRLANIKYMLRDQFAFDNDSIMGRELKPGSIEFPPNIKPVPLITSLNDAMATQVVIRTQDNREIVGHGPGQEVSRLQRYALRLRRWLDKASISID